MIDVPNSVRRESLRVTVASEDLAFPVRQQLQELNRAALIPIIDRVLADFGGEETHIYIDRLDVDLGSFSVTELARLLPDRFERELRERLRDILDRRTSDERVEARSTETARLEAIEQYLLTGTLPFWASTRPFDLEDVFLALLGASPAAVAQLFRRHRSNERLLRRTVLRLGEKALTRLLHVLAPDDAALIILYIGEIRDYHAIEPLIPATDDVVARTLWVVALSYVLRDPGTQFNRISLLRSLLEGLARTERWTYQDILLLFDLALQETRRRLPVGTTLLASVMELIEQEMRVNPWYEEAVRSATGSTSVRSSRQRAQETGAVRPSESAETESSTLEGDHAVAPSAETAMPASASSPSVPPAAIQAPSRYEFGEALRLFLRSGVLPWSFVLHHPGLTPADVTARLPELTWSMLRSLTDDLSPDEQVRAWHRATRAMSEETLVRVLSFVRDYADRPARGPSPDVVLAPRQQLDRQLLRAREIVALLYGRHDTDADWWSIHAGRSLPIEAPSREAHWIKSVLMARATGAGVPEDERSSTSLLTTLVQVDAEGTRQWLRTLRHSGVRISPLVDEPPSAQALEASVHLLLPPEPAAELTVLVETLSGLTAADRPGSIESARTFMLRAVLDRVASDTGDLLPVILKQWFGPSLAPRVIEAVVATAGRLVESGRISAPHAQALTQALQRFDELGVRSDAVSAKDESDHAPTAAEEEAVVLAWLRRASASAEPASGAWDRSDTMRHLLRQVIDRSPAAVAGVLTESVADPRARGAWVASLGESDLARFAGLVEPRRARALLDAAELVFDAWTSAAPNRPSTFTGRRGFWLMFLTFLGSTRDADRSIEVFTRFFFAHVDVGPGGVAGGAYRDLPLRERILDVAVRTAGNAGHAALRAILVRDRDRLLGMSVRATTPPSSVTQDAQSPSPRTARGARLPSDSPGTGDDHRGPAAPASVRPAARADSTPPSSSAPRTPPQPAAETPSPAQASGASPSGPAHDTDARPPAPGTTPAREALRSSRSPESPTRTRGRTAFEMDESDGEGVAQGAPIYIANAGLVLTAPFLPRLFQTLEMLEPGDDGKPRIRRAHISRAVHLLQWMVDGRTAAPEPLLCLNKLLCGLRIPTPVDPIIELTPPEIEVGTALLRSVVANWPILKNTSIGGLQETFLQRDGRLERLEHGWRLLVQRRTVDVLLDHLPWSISTVVHSLMPEPIFVSW